MKDVWFIFLSIFTAGIVSLLLELSLLREFIYIFGSTAVSNALIISIFLVGLALGAYLGTWPRLRARDEGEARRRYAAIQLLNILFVVVFFLSKRTFIYHVKDPNLVRLYFLFAVLIPSLLAGLSYALSVKIMHWRGERFVTYIYAFSTLGSVIGGLAHGIVLVPLWGIRSAYVCAVIFAGIALYTMVPSMDRVRKACVALVMAGAVSIIGFNLVELLFPSREILFSKDSEFGIVEVWKLSEEQARYHHLQLGGDESEFQMVEPAIDLKVSNVHQSFNLPIDRNIHMQWADTSLGIVNRRAAVLLLGYGSGVTATAYLRSPQVERLDIIENCHPVMEAAEIFFPEEYRFVQSAPNGKLIIDDFRSYVRFAQEKYDIIAMDHSIEDPYQIGFFTLEFFDQLKKITKPGGVIIMLGKGTSWNTTRLSFPHIYKNVNPNIERALRFGSLYLTETPITGPAAGDYQPVRDGLLPGEWVYSDEHVRELTEAERTSVVSAR